MRRTLFQKDRGASPSAASTPASPPVGVSSPTASSPGGDHEALQLHEELDANQQIIKSLKIALKEKSAQVDKFRQFLLEFDDSPQLEREHTDGTGKQFEEMMGNVHNMYLQQRQELDNVRNEAAQINKRYQEEARERKNKTQQNGRLAERIFKAENALKNTEEMRAEVERLRHVNHDKESEVAALRQRINRLESESAMQRAQGSLAASPRADSQNYTVHSEGVQFVEHPTRIQLFCQELCDTLRTFLPRRGS